MATSKSPRKRRAAARDVRYNVDESEESDIEFDEKIANQDSSDYIPSKSADSTEEASTVIEEIEIDEENSSLEELEPVTPPSSRRGQKAVRNVLTSSSVSAKICLLIL